MWPLAVLTAIISRFCCIFVFHFGAADDHPLAYKSEAAGTKLRRLLTNKFTFDTFLVVLQGKTVEKRKREMLVLCNYMTGL